MPNTDQGDCVAAARIGDRHTGVRRYGKTGNHTGHDFERDAVLVQEQGFLAPAIEHERIAPLEARNQLPVACLLDQQVADGFLLHGLRRRGADVDQLGALARISEEPRRNEVVVDDHLGGAVRDFRQ